jgi:hypothetical protein
MPLVVVAQEANLMLERKQLKNITIIQMQTRKLSIKHNLFNRDESILREEWHAGEKDLIINIPTGYTFCYEIQP